MSECLLDLLEFEGNDVDSTILIKSYNELLELNSVFFPKLKGAPAELANCDATVEKRNMPN
jgi:hypothetical protein